MSRTYDNWERLVGATLRREQLRELCYADSLSSGSTDFSSRLSDSVSEIEAYDWNNILIEKSNELEQLRPGEISVNGKALTRSELVIISRTNDNWERPVGATPRREQLRELCYADSLSFGSTDFTSRFSDSLSEIDWNNIQVEKSNEAEQLRPGEISVNGKALTRSELVMLLKCPHPPKNLKPGNYWYDRFSGLWGKQGQRPSKIISARLGVGGSLDAHASNGKTRVLLNGREITKKELRLLKYAGVRCCRGVHLWMTEDGSYQEEGSMYIAGTIWSKVGMKLLCSLLSLPMPSKYSDVYGRLSVPHHNRRRIVPQFLFIGCSGSGTTTIFKQAISLYNDVTFLEDELECIKLQIRTDLFGYIRILVQGLVCSLEENSKECGGGDASDGIIYPFGPRLEAFFGWLHASESVDVASLSFLQAFTPRLEELLRNPVFQRSIEQRRETECLPCDDYFLDHAERIFKPDYKPSSTDILYTEGCTSALSCMYFSFPPPRDAGELDNRMHHDSKIRYQLIRSMTDNFESTMKPFEMFEDVQFVIFCVPLSDYDQFVIDNGTIVNKMVYYRNSFERVVENPIFGRTGFLLLLTKYDLFEEKINRSPLNKCDWFNDFCPVTSRSRKGVVNNVGEKGFQYISVKFKRLYTALTGRKLYVAKVNCLEQESVDAALQYAREILKWEEEMKEYLYTS